MPFKCDTVCYRSIQYYLLFGLNRVNGSVLVGGVNFNNYISIQRNKDLLMNVLQGGSGPLQQLNQQFVDSLFHFIQPGWPVNVLEFAARQNLIQQIASRTRVGRRCCVLRRLLTKSLKQS